MVLVVASRKVKVMPNGCIARLLLRLRPSSTLNVQYNEMRSSASNTTNYVSYSTSIAFYLVLYSLYFTPSSDYLGAQTTRTLNLDLQDSRTYTNCARAHRTTLPPPTTRNNGLPTLRLPPAPPRDDPQCLRRPYGPPIHCPSLNRSRPALFHHHPLPRRNLQPSPPRLQNRAARPQTHIARARRQTRDERRVSARGHHEAQEAELGREESC